jgi:type I restriction enzyme M protein
LKNQIDKLWTDIWTAGITIPSVVIEQLTYLLFIKLLDMGETRRERDDELLGVTGKRAFPQTEIGQSLRWHRFKELPSAAMFKLISEKVFPFIKGEDIEDEKDEKDKKDEKETIITPGMKVEKDSAYALQMKTAQFSFPTPLALDRAVRGIEELSGALADADMKGDIYEYMIGKLTTAGINGQFRTPRHIIKMMVELLDLKLTDRVIDPACGTAGFLTCAAQYISVNNKEVLRVDKAASEHFASKMFTGNDFDPNMLRIGVMNAYLHNMDNAAIRYTDSLMKEYTEAGEYTVVLANPPFKGSLDFDNIEPSLLNTVRTKKTELLFVALFLRLLEAGGRCACIVPDGVAFGGDKAHKALREELIERHRMQAVISMPSGVFKPYAGVSTCVFVFTKTGRGGTDNVWFYDMQSDGYSLDDKRADLGTGGDIDDIVARFHNLDAEKDRPRTEKSFLVPKAEIAANGYDLSINKYKRTESVVTEYPKPLEILAELRALEVEIDAGMRDLEGMLDG